MFQLYEKNPNYYPHMAQIHKMTLDQFAERACVAAEEKRNEELQSLGKPPKELSKAEKEAIGDEAIKAIEAQPEKLRAAYFRMFVQDTFTSNIVKCAPWRKAKKDIESGKENAPMTFRASWGTYSSMEMLCKSEEDRKKLAKLDDSLDFPDLKEFAARRNRHGIRFNDLDFSFTNPKSWSPYVSTNLPFLPFVSGNPNMVFVDFLIFRRS